MVSESRRWRSAGNVRRGITGGRVAGGFTLSTRQRVFVRVCGWRNTGENHGLPAGSRIKHLLRRGADNDPIFIFGSS